MQHFYICYTHKTVFITLVSVEVIWCLKGGWGEEYSLEPRDLLVRAPGS